jgi:FkbM family methyltransferase
MIPARIKHKLVQRLKSIYYGKRGEPYAIGGHVLRYTPGSRPVRLKYKDSANVNVRNDARQVELLATGIKPGDCIIDIGAHAGEYAVLMAACAGTAGHVVCFEPDPYAREQLLTNLRLNPNIKPPIVESYACSDTRGEVILYSRGGNSNSSFVLSGIGNTGADPEAIKTPTITLDQYITEKQLRMPDWVKIDAEGAEIRILMGATQLLKSKAKFIVELHPYTWNDFGNTYQQLLDVIEQSGRRMILIDGSQPKSDPEYSTVLLQQS